MNDMAGWLLIYCCSALLGAALTPMLMDMMDHWREDHWWFIRHWRPLPPRARMPAGPADQEFDPLLVRCDQEIDPCCAIVRREPLVWPDNAVPIYEDQYAEPVAFVTRAGTTITTRPEPAADDLWPNLERAE